MTNKYTLIPYSIIIIMCLLSRNHFYLYYIAIIIAIVINYSCYYLNKIYTACCEASQS